MTPRLARWAWLALLPVVLAVFLPALGFGFLRWDDPLHVLDNPLVVAPGSAPWREHLTTPALGYPIPLTVLTYRVEHALFGLHPGAFHATQLVLLLGAVALAGRIALAVRLSPAAAALVAALVGLHPVMAEAVCWVSGRKDLLALALGLGAVLVAQRRPGPREQLAAGLLALAALLAKPSAASLLVVLPALALLEAEPRAALRRRALAVAPLALGLAALIPVAVAGQRAVGALRSPPLAEWARMIHYGLGHHLRLLGLVEAPTAKYLLDTLPPPFTPAVDLAPLGALGVAGALLAFTRGERRRVAAFGLLWAAAAYAPGSGLVPLTRLFADVYVVPALPGIGLALGAALDEAGARATRPRLAAAAQLGLVVALAGALALATLRTRDRFRDSPALWADVMARYPHDYRICRNHAQALYETTGAAGVLTATEACMARFPRRLFLKNRAIALARLGRLPEARAQFEEALAADPADGVIRWWLAQLAAGRAPGAPAPP